MIEKQCIICGKPFTVHNYRKDTAKYCSNSCRGVPLCGHPASRKTRFYKGQKSWITGTHPEYLQGENHHMWSGGRTENGGYILVKSPHHPHKKKSGYVFEHRLVVEKCLGRYLDPSEIVHHIDGNPSNNAPENLFVFENFGYHCIFHKYVNKGLIPLDWLESNIISH